MLRLSQFLQGKRLQGFNVIISTEQVENMNYYMSNKAVTTDWRTTTSLGVMSLYGSMIFFYYFNTRNSVKIKKILKASYTQHS